MVYHCLSKASKFQWVGENLVINPSRKNHTISLPSRRIVKLFRAIWGDSKWRKWKYQDILIPSPLRPLESGIKRYTSLFIELTKPSAFSLDAMYEEAQKFVNVERELKLSSRKFIYRLLERSRLAGNTDFRD